MEWIFAGSLPRAGAASLPAGRGEAPPQDEPSADARLEEATERIARERAAQEQARREHERQRREERLEQSTSRVRESLAAREEELRRHEGELIRELPGSEEAGPPATLAEKLRQGAAKTRQRIGAGLGRIVLGRKEVDRDTLEDLEEVLLTADIGPQTTGRLIKALEGRLRRDELKDPARLKEALQEEIGLVMARHYDPPKLEGAPPVVILFAGVNGSGKTTTIGKLAAQFRRQGKRVLLAAGDTFRAAAAEQLAGWGERADCEVFSRPAGSNPSGVIYQAVEKGLREGFDLVLIDTAGRLHTKSNLMEELKKIKRVIAKLVPAAPQETLLVLDANNGQNAIHQARDFHKAIELTGLIVTKLDGTARGGVLVGIVNEFDLPVRYVGVGEGVDDLRPFDPQLFAESLFE